MPYQLIRRPYKYKKTVGEQGRVSITFTQTYTVLCDDPDEPTPEQYISAVGYVEGMPFANAPNTFLEDIEVTEDDSKVTNEGAGKWRANVVGTFTNTCPETNGSDDPVQARWKRSWATTEGTKFVLYDRQNKLITNSAKDYFENGIEVWANGLEMTWSGNLANWNAQFYMPYNKAVNSLPFYGAAPKTLRVKISAEEVHEAHHHYWAAKFTMIYNEMGWNPQVLNAGLNYIDATTNKRMQFLDEMFQPSREPKPLKTNGDKLPTSQIPTGCNFIEVDWNTPLDFNLLGLYTGP